LIAVGRPTICDSIKTNKVNGNLQSFLGWQNLITRIKATSLMGDNPFEPPSSRKLLVLSKNSSLFNELHVFSFRNHKVFHLFLLPLLPFSCVIIIFDITKKKGKWGEHCMRKQFNGLENLLNWQWSVGNFRGDLVGHVKKPTKVSLPAMGLFNSRRNAFSVLAPLLALSYSTHFILFLEAP
jgi:hypothetical protein